MPRFLGLCLIVMLTSVLAPSQRPIPGRSFSPPPPPSPSRSFGRATARQRALEAGRRLKASQRRGARRDEDLDRGDRRRFPPGDVVDDVPPLPRVRVRVGDRIGRKFVAKLRARADRVRSAGFDADVRLLAVDGTARHLHVTYRGRYGMDMALRHRIEVHEYVTERPVLRERFLIEEFLGERPQAWVARGGKVVPLVDNAFTYPVAAGYPLTLLDLVPYHPRRRTLKPVGESRREGRPTLLFRSRIRGFPTTTDLVFWKFSHLLCRITTWNEKAVAKVVVNSDPRTRDGFIGFERTRIGWVETGDSAAIRLMNRRYNRKLDRVLFEPETFAR